MIHGTGHLAMSARQTFPEPSFTWICDRHPMHSAHIYPTERVLISNPLLIGSIARLEALHPENQFAYLPENIRENHPEDWKTQARHVVGCDHPAFVDEIADFFAPVPLLVMTPESAEMVKHAINGFLAVSIEFAQKIARLADQYGADPYEVAEGVMSDPRIGGRAYLKPDGGLSPHLEREVHNLERLESGHPDHRSERIRRQQHARGGT